MSRRHGNRRVYDDERRQLPRGSRSQRDQRDDGRRGDNRRERDYPSRRSSIDSSYSSSRTPPPRSDYNRDRDKDMERDRPRDRSRDSVRSRDSRRRSRSPHARSEHGGSQSDRRRSRSPPPPRRNNQIINNHQPGGLRSGRLSPPRRERDNERNNSRYGRLSPLPEERDSGSNGSSSGRNSPAHSTISGNRTPAREQPSTARPSRVPSRAPSPVRPPPPTKPTAKAPAKAPAPAPRPAAAAAPTSRPTPAPTAAARPNATPAPVRAPAPAPRPAAPAQAVKPQGNPAAKPKNTRNTFHFLELAILPGLVLQDSHVLQDLAKCMEECEKEDPKTPWEQQEKGKVFLKWFEEYRGSVTKLKPVAPPLSVGNQVMRNHAVLAMKDMILKRLTTRKLFTELYLQPPKEGEAKPDPTTIPKPTIDVQTDVICLLRPSFTKRDQYITFAPYHLPSPSPSNVLITTSPALTNLSGSYPFTLVSAWPSLTDLKRVAFLWDNHFPSNDPGPLAADLAFLYPGNLPSLETIYILHPEIRPRSEWFWVSPECDTFRGGKGSEALFVEVREVDVEGKDGTGKESMWEVLGEENGKGKKDVWGREGETKVSEGVRDALREVKVLEGLYAKRGEEIGGSKGKEKGRRVRVKLMGCIPIKT